MAKRVIGITLTVMVLLFSGCNKKPDKTVTVKSPNSEIYFTIETYYGRGAVSSDFTVVNAHLERNGQSDKRDVLDGETLEIKKIVWLNPNEAIICLQGGFTNTFRNQTNFHIDDHLSNSLHTYLQESEDGVCSSAMPFKSNQK